MSPHHTDATKRLFRVMLLLKTEEECAAFFDDICTIREIQDLSQRLEVAEMLKAGKNYQEISRATGASTATICRVNKCLNYGSDGYRRALEKMSDKEAAR